MFRILIVKHVNFPVHSLFCRRYAAVTNSNNSMTQQYCLNIVQQYDYENFLCTLLLNGENRRFAFAIRALNAEVSRIASMVTEDVTGRLRFQFWKDSIDHCYDREKTDMGHPVLNELKFVIDKKNLNKVYLKRLISSRDRPSNRAFMTIKEMEDYAEQTVSSLYYLLLEIWNIKDVNVDHAMSHLGKAQGITNLMRGVPLQGRSNSVNIPHEILLKNGVSQERIIRDKENDKGVEECIFQVATIAHQHLYKARSLARTAPRDVNQLFLPAVAVGRYLKRLQKANFRLSDSRLQQRDQLLPIAYYWSKISGKY